MRKPLALILAVLLALGLFAGCAQSGGNATATPAAATAAPSDNGGAEETADNAPKAVLDGGEFQLPIVDNPITFTMWQSSDPGSSGMNDLNESTAYIEAEKRTGVHWEFYCVSSANAAESFSIAMAGNEYDDLYIAVGGYLVNGADWYIDNDIFVDLQPKIPEYAPNYDYVRRLTDGTYVTTITDSGKAPGFYQIVQTLQWAWLGPMGRTDWVKDLGLDMPTTYDDYHDMLVAFRDNYNPERPLALPTNGLLDWLMTGFDTTYTTSSISNTFLNIDGKAVCGALQPGFKEYVQLMAQWFEEGLIDPYFYSREATMDNAPILNGEIGIQQGLYCNMDNLEPAAKATGDDKFEYRGFTPPVKNVGDTRKIVMGYASTSYNKFVLSTISTSCENVEVLMRWIDYFFTEEGALLHNYGIQGLSFEYDDNGKPYVTDVIYNNPDGLASYYHWQKYMMGLVFPAWYDWEREILPTASQAVWDTKDLFDGNWKDEYTMPTLSLTQAESAEFSKIMNDINTYLAENIVRYISCQIPMGEFDGMIGQLNSMGIDRATAIQQAALDRYLARS